MDRGSVQACTSAIRPSRQSAGARAQQAGMAHARCHPAAAAGLRHGAPSHCAPALRCCRLPPPCGAERGLDRVCTASVERTACQGVKHVHLMWLRAASPCSSACRHANASMHVTYTSVAHISPIVVVAGSSAQQAHLQPLQQIRDAVRCDYVYS